MKKALITIPILIFSFWCFAQTETFDIATYKIPKGWTKGTKEGLVTYATSDVSKKAFCTINVYASAVTKGTVKQEFERYWKAYAATAFNIKAAPEMDTTSDDDGRKVIIGTANFKSGSITAVAILYAFVGFGRTTNILFCTNDEGYQKDIDGFLTSLELRKAFKEPISANITVAPKTTSATSITTTLPSKTSNNLEGVWMALHLKKVYLDKEPTGNLKWITFFPNGRVIKVIPDEGMNNFNSNDPGIGYYQISNGKAALRWFNDLPFTPITLLNNNQLTFEELYSNDTYFRCATVNGLKLQGTWTSYDNVNDPDLNDNTKNRSMIAFGKDGSFIDYGVFARDLFYTTPAGDGTYEIRNFTLTLHYKNGTTYNTAFSGSLSLDPGTNNQLIYIHRLGFHKK
ncbi:MAG: hypothetical protein ABIX01_24335 [Chitinophagaceae bacterium]